MAKFCSNCGAQMEDEDKVCSQCGTPFAGASANPAPAPAAPAQAPASAGGSDSGKTGKIIKLIACAVAAIVLIVVAVNIAGNFTGYKGTLNKMAKALQAEDIATLESLSSSIREETLSRWSSYDVYDYYEDVVSDALDTFEDSVGTIKKISYEITDETEMSDRRLDDLKDNLIQIFNMDTSSIKKVVKLDLRLTVKGSKKSSVYTVRDLYMVKERGGWKFYYGDDLSNYT